MDVVIFLFLLWLGLKSQKRKPLSGAGNTHNNYLTSSWKNIYSAIKNEWAITFVFHYKISRWRFSQDNSVSVSQFRKSLLFLQCVHTSLNQWRCLFRGLVHSVHFSYIAGAPSDFMTGNSDKWCGQQAGRRRQMEQGSKRRDVLFFIFIFCLILWEHCKKQSLEEVNSLKFNWKETL